MKIMSKSKICTGLLIICSLLLPVQESFSQWLVAYNSRTEGDEVRLAARTSSRPGSSRPSQPSRPSPQPSRPSQPPRPAPQPSRPVSRPPAQQPSRPPVRPPVSRPPVNRPSRPVAPPLRPVRPPRPVYRPVPNGHFTYRNHPYVPHYWGPTWRPIGFVAATLAATAIAFTINNMQYHYSGGVYYMNNGRGFEAVPAPVGAMVTYLPNGYTRILVSGNPYYYYGGVYYVMANNRYRVVSAPVGAIITQLPEGAREMAFDNRNYIEYNGTYYEPISYEGQDSYIVVDSE